MDTFEKLYFAINYNPKYEKKGLIRYQHKKVKKEGDIVGEYVRLNLIDKNNIQVIEGKETAYNVDFISENCYKYSSERKEEIKSTLTFEKLQNSEYWENVLEKYKLNESAFERYKQNYCYEDKDTMRLECASTVGHFIEIEFNKINNELWIWTKEQEFTGNIYELRLLKEDEYEELVDSKKIIDLIKEGHAVDVLKKGYVIDKKYYENISDYFDSLVKEG